MGGKEKHANRTKNNARPSSSGRSAELLGGAVPQTVGFSCGNEPELRFYSFSGVQPEEFDSSIDTQFQYVLKRLSKKCPQTRLNALKEFEQIVENSDEESLLAVVRVWPHFYNVLATDVENRVRVAAHSAHRLLSVYIKRRTVFVYLKQLVPACFTSQCDTYAPAATAARYFFKSVIGPEHYPKVVMTCQAEILTYINDNLHVQTAQSLSYKHATAEEAEAKAERVIIACLQGYHLYLEIATKRKIKEAKQLNDDIISNAKFWEFAKHKVPRIRAAWFKALSVICHKAVFLLDGKDSKVTATVFKSFDEDEPTVVPYVWECVLLVVSKIPKWWKYVNVEELYLSKLWEILKNGGRGNASVVHPNLLPLISHLPPSIREKGIQFYNSFFENLFMGFKQKSVTVSRLESLAVAKAFVECFQYVIEKKRLETPECETLIKTHLISSIEWCLIIDQLRHKTLFNHISSLIQNWCRTNTNPLLTSLSDTFFDGLLNVFHTTLRNADENVFTKKLELLQSLKHNHKHEKVKFDVQTDEKRLGIDGESSLNSDEVYQKKLHNFAKDICKKYFSFLEEHPSEMVLGNLCSILVDFDSRWFFDNLVDEKGGLMGVYENVLRKWLVSNEMRCKSVLDLTFLIFPYLVVGDQETILEDFSKLQDETSFCCCVSKALSHPYNRYPIVKKWLKCDQVSKFIVSIVDKQINDQCTPELGVILKLVLTEDDNGELYLNKSAVPIIANKLTKTLLDQDQFPLVIDSCASLSAYVSTIIYTENTQLQYGDNLLLCLFEFSCKNTSETEEMSSETLWEVNTSWEDAVTVLLGVLPATESEKLIIKFVEIVEKEFSTNTLANDRMEQLSNVLVIFLRAVYKSLPSSVSTVLDMFFKRPLTERRKDITAFCKSTEYIKGDLTGNDDDSFVDFREMEFLEYFVWGCLRLDVVARSLMDNRDMAIDNIEEIVLDNLYDYALEQSIYTNYYNSMHYKDFIDNSHNRRNRLKSILTNIDSDTVSKLESHLQKDTSWFWAVAAYNLYTVFVPTPPVELRAIYKRLAGHVTKDNVKGVVHLTQVFSQCLTFDDVHEICKFDECTPTVLRSFITCEEVDGLINEAFDKLEKLRDNICLSSRSRELETIIEYIRLCSAIILYKSPSLTQKHWDLVATSLMSWAGYCRDERKLYSAVPQYHAFVAAVIDLYVNISNLMKNLVNEGTEEYCVSRWYDEWAESCDVYLTALWLHIAERHSSQRDSALSFLPLIEEFVNYIHHVNHKTIFRENNTDWRKYLKISCDLLTSPLSALQFWGYKMLIVLVPGLVRIEVKGEVDSDADDDTDTSNKQQCVVLELFKEKLKETHEIVESMLIDFRIAEDSCRVKPGTDSFTYTLAYLLLWDVLLMLCERLTPELRCQYADWLRNGDLSTVFLNNLFRLMPLNEVLDFDDNHSRVDVHFSERHLTPSNSRVRVGDSSDVEILACWLYAYALEQLPSVVRQWWNGLDTKVAKMVESVTQRYVSPRLCLQELDDVVCHQDKFKKMKITAKPNVREVSAVYTIDETQMELVVVLPANYPLGSPDVQCNKQMTGGMHKQWILLVKKCIIHQNGRIWDGLCLWNNHLDVMFDGVEECYICFAVLHSGTNELPKLRCRTCRKKFHSACLYKWFSTSNNSTCPICRNLF